MASKPLSSDIINKLLRHPNVFKAIVKYEYPSTGIHNIKSISFSVDRLNFYYGLNYGDSIKYNNIHTKILRKHLKQLSLFQRTMLGIDE